MQPSKLAPEDMMQLLKEGVMHLSMNWFFREGVGGGTGAGGSVGDGGRVSLGTTTLSSLRTRLRVIPSTSLKVPPSCKAETESAMKAAVAPRRAKVFLMNMLNANMESRMIKLEIIYPFARQSQSVGTSWLKRSKIGSKLKSQLILCGLRYFLAGHVHYSVVCSVHMEGESEKAVTPILRSFYSLRSCEISRVPICSLRIMSTRERFSSQILEISKHRLVA